MNWFVYFWLGCSLAILLKSVWYIYIDDNVKSFTLGNALMILMLIFMGPIGILIIAAIYVMLNEDKVIWQRKSKED